MRPGSAVRRSALAAALMLAACGLKTPVRPPELVAPETIDALSASNTAGGVRLVWPRPARYVDGSRMFDLAGFRVERASAGAPFVQIAAVDVMDRDRIRQARRFEWTDAGALSGETYVYRVLSFTTDGSTSDPSNIVTIERAVPAPEPTPSR